jgi:hypothetical protein
MCSICHFCCPNNKHFFLNPIASLNFIASNNFLLQEICRFLRLVAYHDWALSPLIVDVNGDLTMKEEGQMMVSPRKIVILMQ